jgi:ferrous iron transport protein B
VSCKYGDAGEVLLVGQANVGKSVLFGQLTGHYALASNYPGTTVECFTAKGPGFRITDTPGIDRLEAGSGDEQLTLAVLRERPDATVLQVGDAKNLHRTLFLTSELVTLERPMALALNMADEARQLGVELDRERLQQELGVPVVTCTATTGENLEQVRRAIRDARAPRDPFQAGPAWGCGLGCPGCGAALRADRVRELAQRAVRRRTYPIRTWAVRLGEWTRQPLTGIPILFVVLAFFYYLVGVVGAQKVVSFLEIEVFQNRVLPLLRRGLLDTPVYDLLLGPYGLISMGLVYALAIVLPLVALFFLAFGLLEDSGYLPRLAVLADALLRGIGLNGRAVLPLVLGLGCGTLAVVSTRVLRTRKERLIAVLLIGLAVPCSAQLGVLLGLVSGLSPAALAVTVVTIVTQLFLVGRLAAWLLPGPASEFIVELPPLRRPRAWDLARKTAARAWWFLREATPLFLAGTLLLFLLDRTGLLQGLIAGARPLVTGWLGLPGEAAQVFLLGFLRRDYGAAGLFALARGGAFSTWQLAVALVTLTLFLPCIASFFMMAKELGWRTAVKIAGFLIPFAFLVGGVVRWVAPV